MACGVCAIIPANLHDHPDIKLLFADRTAEGVRYYAKTGIYPINHGMVLKRSIARAHPWLIDRLMDAFDRANAKIDRERLEHLAYHIDTGLLPADARDKLRQPLVRHGIKANRVTLETCARYSHEQGLTPRPMQLEEIFEPATMER